jgi:hypothetical protein
MREHFIGHAPKQNRGKPAPPVRGHHNDIAAPILGDRRTHIIFGDIEGKLDWLHVASMPARSAAKAS